MARFSRLTVAQTLLDTCILPIYHTNDIELAKKVLKACYEGGIRIFEITNRGDFAHEIFGELNKFATKEYPDMILGAGTINDAPTAVLYMQLGANFIVSPLLDEETAKVCNKRKVLWLPGCGTVTEISKAEELGAEIVKLFPAKEIGGPAFVKNILGPMSHTNLLITGGVTLDKTNMSEWLNAGAKCLGMGTKLFDTEAIENGEFEKISNNISKALSIVKSLNTSR